MEFYQPYSFLLSHSDGANSTLRIHTRVYMPANQNLMRSKFDEGTSGYTKIKFKAVLSSTEREDRVIEVIKEFDWDGNARFVETEVYDLADSCAGKNSLHSDNASLY